MAWKLSNLAVVSALTFMAALSGGCATSGSLDEVRQEAQVAQRTANEANQTAQTALATAQEAQSLAADANARSMSTEESINRMFRRSMYK
jgi:murein lipoprotein